MQFSDALGLYQNTNIFIRFYSGALNLTINMYQIIIPTQENIIK